MAGDRQQQTQQAAAAMQGNNAPAGLNGIPNFAGAFGSFPNTLQPLGSPSEDTDATALVRLAAEQSGAVIIGDLETLQLTPFAVLPNGKRLQSLKPLLDEYLPRPSRATGFAVLDTLAAFVTHVKRHADPRRTVIFASRTSSQLVAIYDYHSAGTTGGEVGMFGEDALPEPDQMVFGAAGEPGWCGHGAVYNCPLSPAWLKWTQKANTLLPPVEFAEFLEDRIQDVVPLVLPESALAGLLTLLGGTLASPTALLNLSRNLQVNVNSVVRQAQSLSSGEVDIAYSEQHQDGTGQPLRVPSMFAIGVPVYQGGERYQLGCKLRYRLNNGKLTWHFQIHRVEDALDVAFQRVLEQVRELVVVPVLEGVSTR